MSTALSTGRTGGEPSVSGSAAPSGEPGGAGAPHRRSHKKSLPPPETAAQSGEPSASGSAAAPKRRAGREEIFEKVLY